MIVMIIRQLLFPQSIDDVLQRDKFTNISTSSTSSFIRKGSSSSNATEPLPQIPQVVFL